MSTFYYGGSLPEDSSLYVGRKKTLDDLIKLAMTKNPEYAIIFGAPRTGKTSLINQLRLSLRPHVSLHIVYVGQHDEGFYSYIAGELMRLSQKQLAMQATDVHNGNDFQRLLRALAPSVTTVFVFEHLKDLSKATLKNFADILRNTSEMRFEEGNEAFHRFCFMLTGGIELYQATGGSAVSPLNGVAKEFYLGDFQRSESDELLCTGFRQEGVPDETIAQLCEKIYAQVHGHPYLTQYLGDQLVESWKTTSTIDDDAITESIDNFLNNDNRFTAMLDQARQEGLLDSLREIMQTPPKRLFMRGDKKVAMLEAIGFIREEKRFCIIRNAAYTRRLVREFGEVAPITSSFPSIEAGKGNGNQSIPPRPLPSYRSIPCVLQLTQQPDHSFLVQVVDTAGQGDSKSEKSTLPYTQLQLIAVFKALLPAMREQYALKDDQIKDLQRLGLWVQENHRPIVEVVRKIGQDLYEALMVGEVGKVFDRVLEKALKQNASVALQLRLNPADTELARYPWELLCHPTEGKLLLTSRVEVVRHMTYAAAQVNPQRITSPVHMLYISSRPKKLDSLPSREQDNVHQVLKPLQEGGKLAFTPLSPPTFPQLQHYLLKNRVRVLHFDGHGKFGRRCPRCKAFNHSIFDHCQICQESLADVDEAGYLSFEDECREEHAISSEELSYLMARSNIRLAVLSACYSGTVDGYTLFGGAAQALIKQGVMAAIAPQLPISPDGAALFARGFYEALAETNSLLAALNRGRQSLLTNRNNEWFVPAFYTRLGNYKPIDKVFP